MREPCNDLNILVNTFWFFYCLDYMRTFYNIPASKCVFLLRESTSSAEACAAVSPFSPDLTVKSAATPDFLLDNLPETYIDWQDYVHVAAEGEGEPARHIGGCLGSLTSSSQVPAVTSPPSNSRVVGQVKLEPPARYINNPFGIFILLS